MPIVKSNSGDPPSGITINNHNQQSEPLLSSIRLGELLQKRNRKKLALYFFIGFVVKQCIERVIGYYRILFRYNSTDSQLSKLTHLVIEAAHVDKNGTIYFSDLETQKKFLKANERARSFGVKTLIAFFTPLTLLEFGAKRELINSIINFKHDNRLDGIEISSEFSSTKQGYQNALEFCKELRQKLRSLNRTDFIISLSVSTTLPDAAIKDFIKYVDFVNVQTNLYYAPNFYSNNRAIGPPTPLHGNRIFYKIQDLNQQMKLFSCRSGSPSKLNMMVEFKGHFWINAIPPKNPSDTLCAEIPTNLGFISWGALKNSKVWDISKASWNEELKTPYIWNPENRTCLVFENERSIEEKIKYGTYKHFGGVTIRLLGDVDDVDFLINIVSSKQRYIIITIYPYKIRFNLEPHSEFAQIEYKKHHQGAIICWYDEAVGYKQEKLMRKEDFVELAVNDLDVYLKLVKPVLPSLRIIFKPVADYGEEKDLRENDTMRNTANYFLRLLRAKLKARAHPLQVKAFTMKSETLKQHQVMSVLPYLKSKSLETIEFLSDSPFFQAFQHRDREKIDLDALVGMEQWKRAKCVKNLNFSETIPIRKYGHLESVHFIFQSLSSEYLRVLKEAILESSDFKYCKIEFLHFHDVYHLQKLFGKSIISENRKSKQ
ncbi:unnamed protein product [Caenorhabditis brenneri]